MKLYGLKDGKKDEEKTQRFMKLLKSMQQDGDSGVTVLHDVLKKCDAKLIGVGPGCVKLTLRVYSQEGLERLWAMYSSGELERLLKRDLPLDRVNIEERDYQEGRRFFEESVKPTGTYDDYIMLMNFYRQAYNRLFLSNGGRREAINKRACIFTISFVELLKCSSCRIGF